MARARNIKPAFFTNDELAEIEPLGRLLFAGLWTIADYKGDFEYRIKRIKAQILPYDDLDIEQVMFCLCKSLFVTIYNVEGVLYGHVNNFEKHQHPHPNEKKAGSDIPEFKPEYAQGIDLKEVFTCNDKQRLITSQSITNRADSLHSDSLHSDSLHSDSLHSDSPNLIPSKTIVELKPDDNPALEVFEFWQKTMGHPKAAFDEKRKAIINKFLKLYSKPELMKAIFGCSVTPHNMGDNDRGEVYDSLKLIFRDADQVDRFIKHAERPPTGKIKTIEQTQSESRAQAERIKQHMRIGNNG